MKRFATVSLLAALLSSVVLAPEVTANASTQKTITVNGAVLSHPYSFVASDGSNQTTYMPIWYVGQALEAAGFTQSWDGTTHTWTLSTATNGDFSAISVGSGQASIVVNGKLVKKINTYVRKDPAAGANAQPTVYMPIYYVDQLLNAAGIAASWNGQTWAVRSPSSNPIVFGFVTNYGGNTDSLVDLEAHSAVTEFSTFTDSITSTGGLTGSLYTQAGTYAQDNDLSAYVTVTNMNVDTGDFDGTMAAQIFGNATDSSTLINNLVNLVKGQPFVGVNIDFEMLPTSSRAEFSQFLTSLQKALHDAGKKLSVDVPAVTDANSAYNYSVIGQNSDEVMVMAYDYSYPGGPAGPIAPVPWVKQVMSYATSQIPSNKVLLGIPVYGYDWANGKTTALTLNQVDQLLSSNSITPEWDATDEEPYFTYTESGVQHTVYYENAESISDKLQIAKADNLRGIAIWRIGLEDSQVWQPIEQFASGE
ncbi:glycosyl hydrolase family 18 protein [Alicyclobacillus fastidiosus]|uniref:Glycosyl hydrolase family 18 protein n=1 Tax=Alicyclobacillus fastidiosus TaxID=392011 RepID=A0ABY6ZFW9_9BACL|nr:glycosyl hydrolase family 18 protein [Alicyclobacillus fastidiosus]WAH41731.1 glycosyl hydrolase family 18 protein [Alicyclobacillus fastidiosus]GMA63420.1 chitinase [Alicyclobacillus fastidiosus]